MIWLIPIALAIIGAAAKSSAAAKANRSLATAQESAEHAAAANAQQVAQVAAYERQQARHDSAQVVGRVRVAAASAGIGLAGSFDAIERGAEYNEALRITVSEQNRTNRYDSITNELAAAAARLRAQFQDPILAAFMGGVQGFASGLGIANGASALAGAGGAGGATTAGSTLSIGGAGAGAAPSYGYPAGSTLA